jgi:hypothetical protein
MNTSPRGIVELKLPRVHLPIAEEVLGIAELPRVHLPIAEEAVGIANKRAVPKGTALFRLSFHKLIYFIYQLKSKKKILTSFSKKVIIIM